MKEVVRKSRCKVREGRESGCEGTVGKVGVRGG